jgi:heme A synthase
MIVDGRLRRFSWAVLGYVLVVIVWGALVRATGSGAGCGSHWPTCNGEVVPTSPTLATVIELTHRATSGLAALLVLVQLIWVFRVYPRGHRVRQAVGWSATFMLGEVAIGAGIVLLHYVADNASVGRALWMAVHLMNTFLLMGAMTLTAHFAGGAPSVELKGQGWLAGLGFAALFSMLAAGMTGAVAALGDTLFPEASLGAALASDWSETAHLLVRLRVAHPVVAIVAAAAVLGARAAFSQRRPSPAVAEWAPRVRFAVMAQLALGLVNMMLLAPTWLQLAHLLLAEITWIAFVMLLACAFAQQPGGELASEAQPEAA